MNRVIKFRVWDENNSEGARMHYFDQMEICDNGVFFQNSKFDLGGGHNDGDNQVLMQFTGLLDKDGREIYEGDICTFINPYNKIQYTRVVRYCPHLACFGLYPDMTEVWQYESDWLKITDVEIIGDIYSNPELLNQ